MKTEGHPTLNPVCFLDIGTGKRFLTKSTMKSARKEKIDLNSGDYSDEAAYRLMQSGLTFGVFQLEGQGMRDTLRKVKPTSLEDVIALI